MIMAKRQSVCGEYESTGNSSKPNYRESGLSLCCVREAKKCSSASERPSLMLIAVFKVAALLLPQIE